jgi:hypothetical protein
MIKARFGFGLTFFFAIFLLLNGCGGDSGGGDDDDAGDDEVSSQSQQGVFIDAPVAGISYETGGEIRITDEDGRFNYVPGVEVAFLIGGIQLGTAEGNNVITPIDLVAEANDADHPTVINILRFIQTLDDDGNPDNGITITAVVRDMAGGRSVNFAQSVADFESDSNVISALDELTAASAAGARTLVAESDAVSHFETSLANLDIEGGLETDFEAGEEITPEEAFSFYQDRGDALYRVDSISNSTSTLENFGFEYTQQSEGELSSVYAYSSEADNLLVDICTANAPISTSREDFVRVDPEVDDSESTSACSNFTTRFFRLGQNTLGSRVICDGEAISRYETTYLGEGSTFRQGALDFTSDQFDDLPLTDEVCGSIGTSKSTISGVPEDSEVLENGTREVWDAIVGAPYQNDQRVFIQVVIDGPREAGNYTVGAGARGNAGFRMISSVFGTPSSISGQSGTVTVDSISATTVAGSYDVQMITGDRVQGSFELDLND